MHDHACTIYSNSELSRIKIDSCPQVTPTFSMLQTGSGLRDEAGLILHDDSYVANVITIVSGISIVIPTPTQLCV